jgi:hypothetical protein
MVHPGCEWSQWLCMSCTSCTHEYHNSSCQLEYRIVNFSLTQIWLFTASAQIVEAADVPCCGWYRMVFVQGTCMFHILCICITAVHTQRLTTKLSTGCQWFSSQPLGLEALNNCFDGCSASMYVLQDVGCRVPVHSNVAFTCVTGNRMLG